MSSVPNMEHNGGVTLNVTPLFANYFAETVLTDIDNQSILDYALCQSLEDPGRKYSNYGGWQSKDIFEPPTELKSLHQKIQLALDHAAKHLCIKQHVRLKLGNLWININYPGNWNMPHCHPKSALSGCYYVEVPSGSGEITFFSPIQAHPWCFSSDLLEKRNTYNISSFSRMPVSGSLFLFPPWLMHNVNPNTSNQPRVSIAFNAVFQNIT